VPSGYGSQTALFAERFRDAGHDVAISATWGLGGAALDWREITVYPADERWGNRLLPEYARKHQADITITLVDVWVLNPETLRPLNVACWTPVDHQPTPPKVIEFFRRSGARPIAMSRFGERMLREEGLEPLYVPHGIDTGVFRPTGNREIVRGAMNVPEDGFLVAMVANNHGHTPPRKAFPQAVMAFSEFRRSHPDAYLYIHSEVTGERSGGGNRGINLVRLCERYQVPQEACRFAPQIELEVGIPAESMAAIYSSADVLLNPSYGEGFGIPIVEAQACGVPVIVTDWTSMTELCGVGSLVGGVPTEDPQHESFFMAPDVGDIIQALEDAYQARGDPERSAAAVEFAAAYDADHVMESYWKPVLEQLGRPREIGALPNRAARRRAARTTA
jgi:glycosyltransferase involved in cell wall biosynthesis